MPMHFNSFLDAAGIESHDVRLLRHKDRRSTKGRSVYELWLHHRSLFEDYQSTQSFDNVSNLDSRYWASFVATESGDTVFVGLYEVQSVVTLKFDMPSPNIEGKVEEAGSCNHYKLAIDTRFQDLDGELVIEWGLGKKRWIQRADKQNKVVTGIHSSLKKPVFPAFRDLVSRFRKNQ
jgi:hypothetical protein